MTIGNTEDGVRVDVKHCRETECDGLATACLSDADYVPTGKSHWPSLALDGRRLGETLSFDG